jgi:hypothetical protein
MDCKLPEVVPFFHKRRLLKFLHVSLMPSRGSKTKKNSSRYLVGMAGKYRAPDFLWANEQAVGRMNRRRHPTSTDMISSSICDQSFHLRASRFGRGWRPLHGKPVEAAANSAVQSYCVVGRVGCNSAAQLTLHDRSGRRPAGSSARGLGLAVRCFRSFHTLAADQEPFCEIGALRLIRPMASDISEKRS